MSIRSTTILFVVMALLGLTVVLLVTQQVTLARHFDEVEQGEATENLSKANEMMAGELQSLRQLAVDRARLAENFGLETIRTAGPATWANLNIDWVALLNPNGVELGTARPAGLPADLLLSAGSSAGVELLPDGLAALAAEPVRRDGETVAVVVLGRWLDGDEMVRLSKLARLNLQVLPAQAGDLPAGFARAREMLLADPDSTLITQLDEVTLGGYATLKGISGEPSALLQVQLPRIVYRSGQLTKNYLSISLVLSALIFGATILYILEGLVISRITLLNREVTRIAGTGDLSARVSARLNDELTSLSGNINQMLASLESGQREQAELLAQVRAGRRNLQRLSRQLVQVQEAERRRIALELHDEVGQILTGLKLMLDSSRSLPPEQQRAQAEQSLQLVNELIGRVRQMSLELRPAMLDDLGLLPALLWQFDRYTAQTGIRVLFQHSGLQDRRFPSELETAAYRVAQEALTNAARHSGAGEVEVRAWYHEGTLGIQLADHGRGFDPESAMTQGHSTGLLGIRERVDLLGGELQVVSSPGEGTNLNVTFPVDAHEEGAVHDDQHPVSG
jgi:signal transduction histidine kinase